MIFAIFLKMAIPIMAISMKHFEIHIYGEFVKIQEFTQVIIFVIFPQNSNSGLTMKVLKILGIQPTNCVSREIT